MGMGMKGWRTMFWGLVLAVVPSAFQYLSGIDWTAFFPPNLAMFIGGAMMIIMRYFTDTAFGSKT